MEFSEVNMRLITERKIAELQNYIAVLEPVVKAAVDYTNTDSTTGLAMMLLAVREYEKVAPNAKVSRDAN